MQVARMMVMTWGIKKLTISQQMMINLCQRVVHQHPQKINKMILLKVRNLRTHKKNPLHQALLNLTKVMKNPKKYLENVVYHTRPQIK